MRFFKFICEKSCPRLDIGRLAGRLGQMDETRQVHQKLGEPKLYDNYVTVNEMGIPTQVEQLPNPQYIEGTPRIVLEVLSDLLPSGQAIQLADAFDTEGMTDESIANAPYRWMGYSLLVTFLTSVLGIALFRKKEIR